MLGEKFINPDLYTTGKSTYDDGNLYTGYSGDMCRGTYHKPYQDLRGYGHINAFGSAHIAGCHMSLCDGSVRLISYTIDPEIHSRLGDRADGLTIDGKAF